MGTVYAIANHTAKSCTAKCFLQRATNISKSEIITRVFPRHGHIIIGVNVSKSPHLWLQCDIFSVYVTVSEKTDHFALSNIEILVPRCSTLFTLCNSEVRTAIAYIILE